MTPSPLSGPRRSSGCAWLAAVLIGSYSGCACHPNAKSGQGRGRGASPACQIGNLGMRRRRHPPRTRGAWAQRVCSFRQESEGGVEERRVARHPCLVCPTATACRFLSSATPKHTAPPPTATLRRQRWQRLATTAPAAARRHHHARAVAVANRARGHSGTGRAPPPRGGGGVIRQQGRAAFHVLVQSGGRAGGGVVGGWLRR